MVVVTDFAFLFDRFPRPAPGARELHRRLLGNIGSMVEEAEGRHITNHQLLCHLKALTMGMYRGCFVLKVMDLDDVRNAGGESDDDEEDKTVAAATAGKRSSFALCSPFNKAKCSRVTSLILGGGGGGGGDDGTKRMAAVVGAKNVGKTTLVKHACDDERVRIEWFKTPNIVRAGGRPG
ncbi:hypothetical protein BAE44_0000672 [Dichanthelium oligosanthes]|uniref:Uncharacterized protein n=1 Tax=Dichanthelium oligosanthes TaxID=888268 RepID=A0A1E5WLR3_9POAL|nr:hypothetical protein BAE44_0000672 [Dichanthelium oligosanthes]